MQRQLSDIATAGYTGLNEAVRNEITREIKKQTQALTFNLISGFHLIARFKADIRAGLMKKQKELINMAMIKAEAMEIEAILEESKRKSNSNGSNGNGNKSIVINQINEEEQENINGIRGNGSKNQNYNTNNQGNKNGPVKCTHCKK